MSCVVVSSILILRTNGHIDYFCVTPGVLRGWVCIICVYYIFVILILISYEHNLLIVSFIYPFVYLNILWTQFSWLFHLYIEVVYYVVIDRFNTLWTQSAVLFHLLSNCTFHFMNTLCVYLCYNLSMCPSILRVYILTCPRDLAWN